MDLWSFVKGFQPLNRKNIKQRAKGIIKIFIPSLERGGVTRRQLRFCTPMCRPVNFCLF